MPGEPSIGWSDDIECDGGQLLVANVDDFAHWPGASRSLASPGYDSVHGFGGGRTCYLWNAVPGSVRITADSARTSLCLVQVDYAQDEAGRGAAHAFALAYQSGAATGGLSYCVSAGPVIVACARSSARATSTAIEQLPLSGATPGALVDFSDGSNAAALWLAPGRYTSSLFYHEEDRWGVSWCRLRRTSS